MTRPKRYLYIVHNEWRIISAITSVFIIGVLYFTNALHLGPLAKVDFISDFNYTKGLSSWSPDNFGHPSGLSQSEKLYKIIVSSLPAFGFRDLIFYYLAPILFAALAIFRWVDFNLQQHKIEEAKLVASYAVLFFFSSIIFVGVFAYGWNLLTILPVAGLALSCHGIDRFYKSEGLGGLFAVALGAFFVGGMIHFLLVPLLYAIDKDQKVKKLIYVVLVIMLANSYTLVPQIFQTLATGAGHYQGVDPVQQTKEIQQSLGMIDRLSGAIDSSYRPYWSRSTWTFVSILGFLGVMTIMRYRIGTFGARMAFFLFAGLNSSGIFWDLSLNRLWAYLPVVGGMFRNPDKIYIIFSLFIFILAALWLRKRRVLRWVMLILVLTSTSRFYFVSDLRSTLQIANIELPKSYVEYKKMVESPRSEERILLLPIPDWFHFYSWIGRIQVTNILRKNVSTPVISDEMVPTQNIPKRYESAIESIYSGGCSDAVSSAKMLGITQIVLQRDLISRTGEGINVGQTRLFLDRCFGSPVFTSNQLIAYNVKGSPGRISLFDTANLLNLGGNINSALFGFKVCSTHDKTHELVLREKTSELTYLILDSQFRRLDSYVDVDGWRRWVLPSAGCYYLVNTNSVVSITSMLLTLMTLLILLLGVLFVYCRRTIGEYRLESPRV